MSHWAEKFLFGKGKRTSWAFRFKFCQTNDKPVVWNHSELKAALTHWKVKFSREIFFFAFKFIFWNKIQKLFYIFQTNEKCIKNYSTAVELHMRMRFEEFRIWIFGCVLHSFYWKQLHGEHLNAIRTSKAANSRIQKGPEFSDPSEALPERPTLPKPSTVFAC